MTDKSQFVNAQPEKLSSAWLQAMLARIHGYLEKQGNQGGTGELDDVFFR
jgi:hypothetical protein